MFPDSACLVEARATLTSCRYSSRSFTCLLLTWACFHTRTLSPPMFLFASRPLSGVLCVLEILTFCRVQCPILSRFYVGPSFAPGHSAHSKFSLQPDEDRVDALARLSPSKSNVSASASLRFLCACPFYSNPTDSLPSHSSRCTPPDVQFFRFQ